MLKQMHMPDVDYPGRKFQLAAISESGERHEFVVRTYPGET